MVSRIVSFTAKRILIDAREDNLVDVELELPDAEFGSMLDYFDEKCVVRHFGARYLLQNMDEEEIMEYLAEIGIKTEWED